MGVNGCGGEGGFKFSTLKNAIKKLPLVNPKKLEDLYHRIELEACNPHDLDFTNGGNVIHYIKANKKFALKVIELLQWTTAIGRIFIFLLAFGGTTLFGFHYFNWK